MRSTAASPTAISREVCNFLVGEVLSCRFQAGDKVFYWPSWRLGGEPPLPATVVEVLPVASLRRIRIILDRVPFGQTTVKRTVSAVAVSLQNLPESKL